MSIHILADKTAAYIAEEIHTDKRSESRMAFGLELLLGALIKLVCIMILAYYLGIFPQTLIIAITAGILRLASGGEHCQEYYRCLIGGTAWFLLLGWGTKNLDQVILYPNNILILLFIFLVVMISLWRYAPGDTENKPITEEADKAKFKRWSLIIATFFFIAALSFSLLGILPNYSLPIAAGMIEQTFTVTPAGYRFIRYIDHILSAVSWAAKRNCIKG